MADPNKSGFFAIDPKKIADTRVDLTILMAGSCFSDNHFKSKSGKKIQYPIPSAIAGWL